MQHGNEAIKHMDFLGQAWSRTCLIFPGSKWIYRESAKESQQHHCYYKEEIFSTHCAEMMMGGYYIFRTF